MATYGLPSTKVLAALGRIALRHGQLDNAMKMVMKDLLELKEEVVLDATAGHMSRELRGCLRKLAKQRLGDGRALVQLDALLNRADQVTKLRNDCVHSAWGTEYSARAGVRGLVKGDTRHTFQKAPTLKELVKSAEELETILEDFLNARLGGFLFEALTKKPAGTL